MRRALPLLIAAAIAIGGWYYLRSSSRSGTAAGLHWRFTYSTDGRLERVDSPGGATRFRYEGRRIVKDLPDGASAVFEHDVHGRRVSAANSAGTVRYRHDGYGRLTAIERPGVPALAYGYDTAGRITRLDLGPGRAVAYSYDFLGRVAAIDTPVGRIQYAFDEAHGRTIRTLPNGVRTVSEFQPDGRLGRLIHVAPDGRVLEERSYTYRPDGLIARMETTGPERTREVGYEYDAAQRLAAARDSVHGVIRYRYSIHGDVEEIAPAGVRLFWSRREGSS